MPLVCFIQMRIFIYLRFCVFWGFPLSLVWRFCFAVNLATFSLTYYAGRLMALSKKEALFAILYGLSIYRMQDLFNRQALGEFLALSFFRWS